MSISNLISKVENGTLRVGIVGMGYVGLPLAVEFARKNIHVTGIEISSEKVKSLLAGQSYVLDVNTDELARHVREGRLTATTDYSVIRDLDAISICVPTPLNKTGDPDISFIVAARDEILKHAHPGLIIILESTTYPGTTEELIVPAFEAAGLKVGEDVFIAFSPERVDPGNPVYQTHNTPKVVGGHTANCLKVALAVYGKIIEQTVPVSSTRSAELAKLLENTFRSINIGLVNELAIMCHLLNVDVWEVIGAAATKPFGFMPFYPGPGLGGHCIPIDPIYLSWKLKTLKYRARFIELADEVNGHMPEYVVHRVMMALNQQSRSLKGSKALVLGVAYKRDIDDPRESPSLDIIQLLGKHGSSVSYHDPFIASVQVGDITYSSAPLTEKLVAESDVVVICTDHTGVDYDMIVRRAKLVFDARNATKRLSDRPNVVRL
ncbi:nucleotide sugar dehydrogenase [bacterium]|nr:nucleotide sugar dehydrogenase [bacterium]MBU1982791.1 nucleotide sugar dehydrogenase [bacterium]